MRKIINICDRCGETLKTSKESLKEENNYIYDYDRRFEVCDKCYKELKPIMKKYDEDCEKLKNKMDKLMKDYRSNFKIALKESGNNG